MAVERLLSRDLGKIASAFLAVDSPISREDFLKVSKLPHWEKRVVSSETLAEALFWHFDPQDPDHVGQVLTDGGRSQRLGFVAANYLDKLSFLQNKHPAFTAKVEGLRQAMALGVDMPPLLLVSGRMPGSSMSLVDGNFRALALLVQSLVQLDREWKIEAIVGRKLYFWERPGFYEDIK
jgi:hypothetical protein